MAQEKTRASRARTKTEGESGAAAETKKKTTKPPASVREVAAEAGTTGAAKATKRTAKSAEAKTARVETATTKAAPAKRKAPAAPTKAGARKAPVGEKAAPARKAPARRARTLASVPEPSAEAIAERAYLLWERGEPGDQTEHWLRAEAELRAA